MVKRRERMQATARDCSTFVNDVKLEQAAVAALRPVDANVFRFFPPCVTVSFNRTSLGWCMVLLHLILPPSPVPS